MPGTTSAKVCSKCGKDVSQAKRNKDQFGRYYCADCTQTLATVAAPAPPPAATPRGTGFQTVDHGQDAHATAPTGRRSSRPVEARATTAAARCSLVLLGRFEGKDIPVATALAQEFGLNGAWGQKVVEASPIIMLDELTAEQARQILAALSVVEAAGSQLEVQPGADPGLPKLSWAEPARIKGKLASEYAVPGATP